MGIAKRILICLLIAGVSIFGFILFADLCVQIFSDLGLETPNNGEVLLERLRNDFWWVFFTVAVLPPIMEEFIFRFLVIKSLRFVKLKDLWIILIAALIFMLYHRSWSQTIYQFIMGAVFAVIYIKTNNLLYTIGIHFINNAFIVIYTYYVGVSAETVFVLNFGNIALAISLAVISGAIIYDLIKELPYGRRK